MLSITCPLLWQVYLKDKNLQVLEANEASPSVEALEACALVHEILGSITNDDLYKVSLL